MEFNTTVPWKVHLHGSRHSNGGSRWTRKRFHDNPSAHPTLMKEQDLDHLGAVYEADLHAQRR